MLLQLGYRDQKLKLYLYLHRQRMQIETIVAHHLGISVDRCTVVDVEDWMHGSFNVCLQVNIDINGQECVHDKGGIPGKQYIIRFPLPFRIGENFCPGNADEKVRCEAATYAWLQENCPTVPILQLYGVGLSNGLSFTVLDNLPLFTRSLHRLRRLFSYWLGYPTPSLYVPHKQQRRKEQVRLNTPYLLIEYIKPSQGKMLSETWEQGRHDPELRSVFFPWTLTYHVGVKEGLFPTSDVLRLELMPEGTKASRYQKYRAT
ncbi:hypothetical protein PDIG_15960 [Penicillium digitatum PHI26]|uniref:Aminoglycoside phosphotransferase domain-containing protein n=3 Tax=Penicillium digitatum TaxID=36651 RepID=K9G8J5_PEND2|nr:hypothetical protein PDIP_31530 [Penicillium digitatum Pd1]EKV17302.1 hypothetical protein PDIG_15960 [Penicillium digitatum PHI26]EKV17533.1 hypothetical protein PDIP_31530 [Penicillium digitatum Pd1]